VGRVRVVIESGNGGRGGVVCSGRVVIENGNGFCGVGIVGHARLGCRDRVEWESVHVILWCWCSGSCSFSEKESPWWLRWCIVSWSCSE
jgi:hypothetical protein